MNNGETKWHTNRNLLPLQLEAPDIRTIFLIGREVNITDIWNVWSIKTTSAGLFVIIWLLDYYQHPFPRKVYNIISDTCS